MTTKRFINEEASLLRDAVFAANDGVVTTFAVVAGAFGASFSHNIVITLGVANLIADGISMATGIYMGAKSEVDYEKENHNSHWKQDAPFLQGLVTFLSFCISGFVPLIPYIFRFQTPHYYSLLFISIYLLIVGVVRAKLVNKNMLSSALETFAIGGLASISAYFVGKLIEKII